MSMDDPILPPSENARELSALREERARREKLLRDFTITVALCLSLVLHAGLAYFVVEKYLVGGRIWLAGYARADNAPPIIFDSVNARVGESNGAGDAVNRVDGLSPQEARQASQKQALSSLDPEGPALIGAPPSRSVLPPGSGPGGARAVDAFADRPKETSDPAPFGATRREVLPAAPKLARRLPRQLQAIGRASAEASDESGKDDRRNQETIQLAMRDGKVSTDAKENAVVQERNDPPKKGEAAPEELRDGQPDRTKSAEPSAPVAPPAPAGPGGVPGSPTSPADVAPQAESESDPFEKQGAIRFTRGKVEAQFGRKVKTVRPRLTLKAQYDILAMGSASLVVAVRIKADGRVRSVEVLRSSGSNEIDQPTVLAMYDWWIEPPKDQNGQPMPDLVVWTLNFQ
jgi:TonB family protein